MTRFGPQTRPPHDHRKRAGAATCLTAVGLVSAGLASVLPLPTGTALAGADEGAGASDVKAYCANIAVAASDARFAWQTARLNELEGRIKARIAELDARTAELRGWIAKREDLEKRASEKLVGIYAKMRPETAATQISTLDDDMAAAVLAGLNARQASAIFNEFVPERAAKLAALIAGAPAADKADPGKKL